MASQPEPKETPVPMECNESQSCSDAPTESKSTDNTDSGIRVPMPEFEYESSEESDEDDGNVYVPFSERTEWSDVKPVPQDDGPHKVVAIKYSDRFREVFDYFRAILASNEISKRAFDLTTECLRLNPTNYTVWYYRRKLIEGLNYDYNDENSFIRNIIIKNPKNYQVWEHYKIVLQKLRSAVQEGDKSKPEVLASIKRDAKNFIRDCLRKDSKNYHAWQLLQWLVLEWKSFDGELDYCDRLLDEDIRNNSAWNHRFFILSHTTNFDEDVVDNEIKYTMNLISKAPKNESAWNFLNGILDHSKKVHFENVEKFCNDLADNKETRCNYLFGFLIKYYSRKLAILKCTDINDDDVKQEFQQIYDIILEYYKILSDEVDTFRKNFWNFEQKLFIGTFQLPCA